MSREPKPPVERRDVPLRPLAVGGAAVLVSLLLCVAAMRLLHSSLRRPPAAGRWREATAPGPRLQVDPPRDLAALRRWERAMLSEHAWIDRKAGRVRIPIERAMELVAQREARR